MIGSDIINDYRIQMPDMKLITNEFDKDLFENKFFRNLDILKYDNNYDTVAFKSNTWNHNPAQFCVDEYGTGFSDLYNVILLVNNVDNYFEFTFNNLTEIIKPKWFVIQDIISYKNT